MLGGADEIGFIVGIFGVYEDNIMIFEKVAGNMCGLRNETWMRRIDLEDSGIGMYFVVA